MIPVRRVLPWLLAVSFAAFSFWPARDSIPGFGGDPLFNLWTLEVVRHDLATFTSPWRAPLYGGHPLGIAFSENQLFAALLFWPIRALTGNGAAAMGIEAMALSLLAVACTAGWLRAVGVRSLAVWGGLLFAGCGWLQSQYAHYQNLCVFVLPLALWAWTAYARDPRPARLFACVAAFAWIAGWNLYFLVFADLCLAVLAIRARRPAALALTLALQAAFLFPYAAVSRQIGGYGAIETYGATLRSLFGSTARPRLIAPSFDVPVESAGYLGAVWLVCMALSTRRRESRPWLLAAGLAFWAALGRGYGLFDVLAIAPPVGALRASGRAQVLVILFSLPAALGWLETLRPGAAAGALALVVLDLLPAGRPQRVRVDPGLWGAPTGLARELSRSADPVLALPDADERFMLQATQSWTPYYGGHSGRAPAGEVLLQTLAEEGRLHDAVLLSRARRVVALTAETTDALRRVPLPERGCFDALDDRRACLFEAPVDDASRLQLATGLRREISPAAGWPTTDFFAVRSGVLELRDLDRCRLRRTLRIFGWPALSTALALPRFGRVRYETGDRVLRVEARQRIYRLPGFTADFSVACD